MTRYTDEEAIQTTAYEFSKKASGVFYSNQNESMNDRKQERELSLI